MANLPRPTVLPVFALHTVLFPGGSLSLRVFEDRYLTLMDDVLPDGVFVIAAILSGHDVAGPAETYRVGVLVGVDDHEVGIDGSFRLEVRATERVALIERLPDEAPYPRWRVEGYPDEGGAGTDDVEAAIRALTRYLKATGLGGERPIVPHEPIAASWVIAAAVPGLVPDRQALLEAPGAGERLVLARDRLSVESRLVEALGTGAAGADPAVNPN